MPKQNEKHTPTQTCIGTFTAALFIQQNSANNPDSTSEWIKKNTCDQKYIQLIHNQQYKT